MARHRSVDVLIIGAGPAGCAAALTLAQAGVASTIVAAPPRDTARHGELLLPRAVQVLRELGVSDELPGLPGSQPSRGVRLATYDLQHVTSLPFPAAHGPGWHVDRRELDAVLRAATLRAGVDILPELTAVSPSWEGSCLTGVVARGEGEREEIITSRTVIDASGHNAFLPGRMGWAFPYPRHRKTAAWATFDNVRLPDWAPPDHLLVMVIPGGFLELLPLAGGSVTVAATLDRRLWDEVGGNAERLLGKALGRAPAVDWLLARAPLAAPAQAVSSLAFRVMDVAGHGYCLVGDAAGFFDPVVPHGLLTALLTGASAGLDAADALIHRGRVTAVDSGPTISLTRLLQRQQLALAHALYNADLIAVLMAGHQHLGARDAFISLLAGEVLPPRRWRKLGRAWLLVALAELQGLTRRLGKPVFEPVAVDPRDLPPS